MTKIPRPHAEIIKEWAEGADVQCLHPSTGEWIDSPCPAWVLDHQYRVKPARSYPETTMSDPELLGAYAPICRDMGKQAARNLANAVLRHAIDNCQVVTREEFALAIGDRDKRDMAVAEAMREACYTIAQLHSMRTGVLDEIGRIDVKALASKVGA